MKTKEGPILMSGAMVRASLRGIDPKTQTRRVAKIVPGEEMPPGIRAGLGMWGLRLGVGSWRCVSNPQWLVEHCPYGQPGDRLWVRENFYCDYSTFAAGGPLPKERPEWADDNLYYAADGSCCDQIPECQCADVGKPRWRPSIHMPRWACRLVLEIVSVRLERLQDISEADCIAEGIERDAAEFRNYNTKDTAFKWLGGVGAAKLSYSTLWESINGPGSWALNPWVWVVEFRRVEGGLLK